MTDMIYGLKHRILEYLDESTTDLDRVNVNELGEFVDMVKDLAEAMKYCHEAVYYEAATESMGHSSKSEHKSVPMIKDDLDEETVLERLATEYNSLGRNERMEMKSRVLTILGIK